MTWDNVRNWTKILLMYLLSSLGRIRNLDGDSLVWRSRTTGGERCPGLAAYILNIYFIIVVAVVVILFSFYFKTLQYSDAREQVYPTPILAAAQNCWRRELSSQGPGKAAMSTRIMKRHTRHIYLQHKLGVPRVFWWLTNDRGCAWRAFFTSAFSWRLHTHCGWYLVVVIIVTVGRMSFMTCLNIQPLMLLLLLSLKVTSMESFLAARDLPLEVTDWLADSLLL